MHSYAEEFISYSTTRWQCESVRVCVVESSNRWCWSRGRGAVKAGSGWDSEAGMESEQRRCCSPQQCAWNRGHSQGLRSSRKRPATPYWSHLFRRWLRGSADPAGRTDHLALPPPPGPSVARVPRANPCWLEREKQSLLKSNSNTPYSCHQTQFYLIGFCTPWRNRALIYRELWSS